MQVSLRGTDFMKPRSRLSETIRVRPVQEGVPLLSVWMKNLSDWERIGLYELSAGDEQSLEIFGNNL